MRLIKRGDFYMAFGDDAKELSKRLGLTLCQSSKRQPFGYETGFPYWQLDAYRQRLESLGHTVTVSDGAA